MDVQVNLEGGGKKKEKKTNGRQTETVHTCQRGVGVQRDGSRERCWIAGYNMQSFPVTD